MSNKELREVQNLVRLLHVDRGRVNVKARTHEKVDSVGECRAIECHVVLVMMHTGKAPTEGVVEA